MRNTFIALRWSDFRNYEEERLESKTKKEAQGWRLVSALGELILLFIIILLIF